MLATNRHTLIAGGWLHYQDNRKVIDRKGASRQIIAHEVGLNRYIRTESELAQVALDWWENNEDFWNGVRNFWHEAGESAPSKFSYSTLEDGKSLGKLMKTLQKNKVNSRIISRELGPFVIAN